MCAKEARELVKEAKKKLEEKLKRIRVSVDNKITEEANKGKYNCLYRRIIWNSLDPFDAKIGYENYPIKKYLNTIGEQLEKDGFKTKYKFYNVEDGKFGIVYTVIEELEISWENKKVA